MCSNDLAYQLRSSAIGTHVSRPGSPKTCVVAWELHKIFPRPITPVPMVSQNARTNGWNSICDSGPTINRTTGQCTCQWQNSCITHGTMQQQRCPPFACLWGTNHEPLGKSRSCCYPKSPHA